MDELVISLSNFVATLARNPDFVYAKLLQHQHGREKHTAEEWHEILDALRVQPV